MRKLSIMGDAGKHPAVRESARRMYQKHRNAALSLVERLQIDGIGHNVSIQPEDIERLAALTKRSAFMRSIIIELLICLRTPNADEEKTPVS